MVQKQMTPTQAQMDVQALTLTPAVAAQLMASRVEKTGNEVTSITVVLRLGGDKYLRSRLPDGTVEALKQKLLTLPQAERPDFMTGWIGRAQDAMSAAYAQATATDPKATLFSCPIPPLEVPKADIATKPASEFHAPARAIPTKTDMIMGDTAKAKPPVPLNAALSPLPKGVKGKGTTEKPYLIDLTDKAPKEGPRIDLVIPYEYTILDTKVHFKYTLRPSQVKETIHNAASDIARDLRSLTSQSLEHYGVEQGITAADLPDFTKTIEGAMQRLPGNLRAFVNTQIKAKKNAELNAYFGLK